MALSLSNGRRRWACRAARRGGKGGAGCGHFHVHYHVPRQVWAFSPLRLPARFSLLPYLLILPVLFFAVLAFLVCFGWFTLVYFVSSLWSKGNDHRRTECGSDAGEPPGEDQREERAVKRVTEQAGDSGPSEVCVGTHEIKEVFEDGFSEESRHMSMIASPGICIDDKENADEEKIVTEVMMFETNKEELKAFAELDGCSEKHQQVMEPPFDCFLEDLNTREFSTSLYTAKLLDVPYGDEFVADRKELSVLSSLEILEFIDKHDTAEIVVNGAESDFEIPEVSSSDDSSHHGLGDEQRKEIKQEQSTTELSVNCVINRLPEGILDKWQETENLAIQHKKKLAEDDSMEEVRQQTVSISDQESQCEMAWLPLDSACENESENVAASNTPFHQAINGQDGEFKEELIKNKNVESSTSASAVCDFAHKHWRIIEQLDGFESEDKNEDRDGNCTSTGASRRLPLIRRSPTQWWNLCGVLDAFAGGED
ncbi:hypothetical protein PAHAL_3G369900 [Panicum hallii]|uniref:Uncharacterized protein n=1 Tax=Panicum hallii TaxID=206008 RepID=A0A2S3HDN9_9POAL|nr:uncharacterized protein LOC112887185 isoform X1 [Panicum hallii]XP_025809080.1 uncharacterized protein LOC112887185 isoform X1 [Panicum hallii]XP_025809081.1 uncharacterized protein LOC112887185 isoform X1 [Panicum hallii]PAN20672.1 hypothetical protein PAHAL_3G369900 [Panicum hallii]PAN20673.1 hypothetical protein PAHAL_3G369900 [Panicum hallii]